MKDLPHVFKNSIDKKINNNETYSYGKNEDRKPEIKSVDVYKKIRDIVNSPGYVYKASVTIKMRDGTINKQIIGFNKNYLITYDDMKIPITDIIDIDLK